MKKFSALLVFIFLMSSCFLYAQKKKSVDVDVEEDVSEEVQQQTQDQVQAQAVGFLMGGVFGAVTIDGKNYQQMGLRPELKLWKFGVGLDISILLDEDGKVREEDWDDKEDYIDKIYYLKFGQKGEPFYFIYGGLESTTLGYGTLINGYTNLLEYPTYKRQGLDIGFETKYLGMQAIVNDFKELQGKNRAVMGGGRIYLRPFSRVQIGGSIAGDLNEYKGLRDTDDDGYPDEVDAYPEDDNYVTEIDYYADKLQISGDPMLNPTIQALVGANLISSTKKSDLDDYGNQRSRTTFWSGDAGILVINGEIVKFNIYSQYARSIDTQGWGFTAPGAKLSLGNIIDIYGDYRQQTEDFIFGYYNDTYDLERAKYAKFDTSNKLYVKTKKEKLYEAEQLKGYFAGVKINFFNFFTGKCEYQDMRWGEEENEDKSIRGELAFNRELIPIISKAKAYYVQNNVEKLQWKTESTVMGGVIGIGMGPGLSIDFNYRITYEDKNGDGKIKGGDEEITNVSVSTSAMF